MVFIPPHLCAGAENWAHQRVFHIIHRLFHTCPQGRKPLDIHISVDITQVKHKIYGKSHKLFLGGGLTP